MRCESVFGQNTLISGFNWDVLYFILHDEFCTFEFGREQFSLAAKKSEKQLTEVGSGC